MPPDDVHQGDGLSPGRDVTPGLEGLEPVGPLSADEAEWRPVKGWVKGYGIASAIALVLGTVFLAHAEVFGWADMTSCGESSACTWAMHFIELPIIGYLLLVALYACFRARPLTASRLLLLLGLANSVEVMFFLFDGLLLARSFQRSTFVVGEQRVYFIAMLLLLAGAMLGVIAWMRVNRFLHPLVDPRFEHPRTEGELIQLVKKARAYGIQLRVRGSTHCVEGGIYTDDGGPHINVQLDRYDRIIGWEEGEDAEGPLLRVTVQAGCHLGVDPNNPLSSRKNSLLWQLDKKGWALPDLGGISHQTVSGFILTGSMGGTLEHDLGGAIRGLRLIDGTGKVHDLAPNPGDPNDEEHNPFYAAGVSMGLLGIISTVTLTCRRRYDIQGTQVTHDAVQLLGLGKEGPSKGRLAELFRTAEYIRLLWWPQQGVNKVELWRAQRIQFGSTRMARLERRGKLLLTRRFKRRPFVQVPRLLQKFILHPFFNFISKDEPPPFPVRTDTLVRNTLNVFLQEGEKTFVDSWHRGLPMDDQISDTYMPTVFTELFIDFSQVDRVLGLLHRFFNPEDEEGRRAAEGMRRTGAYAFELYPGHSSRFWLSPCHQRDCVRLDVLWFRTKEDMARRNAFFRSFWELLEREGIDFRPHWGKYLPEADSSLGADYLRSQDPRWDRFMQLRRRMDPEGLFLSGYWKKHLGIREPSPDHPTVKGLVQRGPGRLARGWARVQRRGTQARNGVRRRVGMPLAVRLLQAYFWLREQLKKREPTPSAPPEMEIQI
jgi:hypothetical protein